MRIVKTYLSKPVNSYNNTLYLHTTDLLLKDLQKVFYTKNTYNFNVYLIFRVLPKQKHTIFENLKDFPSKFLDALPAAHKRRCAKDVLQKV